MQIDETLEKLIYEFQFLKGIIENIQQRIDLVNATMAEMQVAISTFEGLSIEKVGSSMLVPIGGGSYVKTSLENLDKIVVGIGADVAVEKTLAEAKEDFQKRVFELEKADKSLQQQFDEASMKLSSLQREIQNKTQPTTEGTKDVRGS